MNDDDIVIFEAVYSPCADNQEGESSLVNEDIEEAIEELRSEKYQANKEKVVTYDDETQLFDRNFKITISCTYDCSDYDNDLRLEP